MVVLESRAMMNANNQYLQPDFHSALPTTDAKNSPLALLAQTCSQIGADTPSSKPMLAALDKPKKPPSVERTSPSTKPEPAKTQESRLVYKPYESTVLTPRPSSKDSEEKRKSPIRKSASPIGKNSPTPAVSVPPAKSASPSEGASPIIRSGMEVLGHPKDHPLGSYPSLKPHIPLSGLGGCCPPGLEATHPAFRPPFPGVMYPQHHSNLLSGYPPPGPYVSYARVKTPAGGEALVPVCKDPYCTSCQFGMHGSLLGGACPSGCTQCSDPHRYNLAAAAALSGLVPSHHLTGPYQLGRPHTCSWIVGDTFCGKRCNTADELLQHLRTHAASVDATSLLNPLRYPSAPLSPLSPTRFHPYTKPSLPSHLTSPMSAFNPTLAPYYSPYALYGQRLGAAVHQ